MTLWSSDFLSHCGLVRKNNEDSYLNRDDRRLWAVADGMGGHEGGQLSSQTIVETLKSVVLDHSCDHYVTTIKERIGYANQRLYQIASERFGGRSIGSTVAVLIGCERQVVCLWAGDSRIYRLRDGRLTLITRDHTLAEDMIANGLLTREEAHNHQASNQLTKAVGVLDQIDLERWSGPIRAGDLYLLCSDGLTKVVSDSEISDYLSRGSRRQMIRDLVRLVLQRGAPDNVTAGVVQYGDDGDVPTIVRNVPPA